MARMEFDISASDDASDEFLTIAAAAERLEERLKRLDKMKVEPKVKLDTKKADADLKSLEKRLKAIKDAKAKVDLDTGKADSDLKSLEARLKALKDVKVAVDLDTGKAELDLGGLEARLKALKDVKVAVDLDTGKARADVDAIAASLKSLRNARVAADVDTGGAEAKLEHLAALAQILDGQRITIPVVVEDAGAIASLEQMAVLASVLSGTQVKIPVNVDTLGATAQLAALQRQVSALRGNTLRIDLNSTGLLGQLAAIQTAMRTIAGGTVTINADTRLAMERLATLRAHLVALSQMRPSVQVEVQTARARAEIVLLERQLAQFAGRQYRASVEVDVDRNNRMGRIQKILGAIAAFAPTIAAGLGQATAALATFGGSIVSTVPLLVASVGMLGGVFATLKLGTQGVGVAMSALSEGDMKGFNDALKTLSPNAQKFTLVLKDLFGMLKSAKGGIQDKLFDGMAQSMKQLGAVEIPVLIRGMGGVATELNKTAKSVMAYIGSADGVARQNVMWTNTQKVVSNLRPAFTNVTAALFDIGEVGSKVLADVSRGAGGATQRFREFIAQARESGKLEQWMRDGARAIGQLTDITGNLGSVFASVFRAAKASGSDLLRTLDENTASMAEFMKSADAQGPMIKFFTESKIAMEFLNKGLADLGKGFMEMLGRWADTGSMVAFDHALGGILSTIGKLLPDMGELGGHVMSALANGMDLAAKIMGPLVGLLVKVLNAIDPIGPGVIAMFLAFKMLTPVGTWLTGLATSAVAMATGMGKGEAAGTRLGAAAGALGRAIPIIGVAAVAAAIGLDAITVSSDEAARAFEQGGAVAAQAYRDMEFQTADLANTRSNLGFLGDVIANIGDIFVTTTDEYKAGLDGVGLAQFKAAAAAAKLKDAIASADPKRIAQANAEYGLALKDVEQAQKDVATATQTTTDKMKEQADLASSLITGYIGVQKGLRAVRDAESDLNQTEPGTEKARVAAEDYILKVDSAAQQIGKLGEAQAKAAHDIDPAARGMEAYGASLLSMAGTASPRAKEAIYGLLDGFKQAQLDALSAGAAATGFATEIIKLPSGKTVKVAIDPETGKILETQKLLDAMKDKKVLVTFDGQPMPAMDAYHRILTAVQQGKATVNIDGVEQPALDALARVSRAAGFADATVNIEGKTFAADSVLAAFIQSVQDGKPTVTIGGVDYDARNVFSALVNTVQTTKATVPIDGDPVGGGFFGKVAGAIRDNLKPAVIPIDGDPVGAIVADAYARTKIAVPSFMNINGNPAGANAASAGAHAAASTPATMPMGGANQGALNAGNQANQNASRPATMPMNGNNNQAMQAGTSANNNASRPAWMFMNANTGPATSVIQSLRNWASQAITFVYRAVFGGASGGIVQPMAEGGVTQRGYAGGGVGSTAGDNKNIPGKTFDGHRLSPMSSRATLVPPRTYRVIGDNTKVPEVFIPLNGSKASLAFTGYAANQQGYGLTPLAGKRSTGGAMTSMRGQNEGYAAGGVSSMLPVLNQITISAAAERARLSTQSYHTQGGGQSWSAADLAPMLAELRGVRAAVLATMPDNAALSAGFARLEKVLATRVNAATSAQANRVGPELSRI